MLYLFLFISIVFSEKFYRVEPVDFHGAATLDNLGLTRDSSPGMFLVPESDLHLLRSTSHALIEDCVKENVDDEAYWPGDTLNTQLENWAAEHHDLVTLFDVGTSELGVPMKAVRLASPDASAFPRPIIRYIGNMHGNEVVSRALLMKFIEHVLEHAQSNKAIRALLANSTLEVMPTMNPDGFAAKTRENINGVDLNRAFPDRIKGWNNTAPSEVLAVMRWMRESPPTILANLHGGSVVCNYPWDNNVEQLPRIYSASPDDALLREVCREYAKFNTPMGDSFAFPDGIVNGAFWYILNGGLQDWVHKEFGVPSVTIEVSKDKCPVGSLVNTQFWPENSGSLVRFALKSQQGVFGTVYDAETRRPIDAMFTFVSPERGAPFQSRNGLFGRVLPVGDHRFTATAPGYSPRTFHVNTKAHEPEVLDIALTKN